MNQNPQSLEKTSTVSDITETDFTARQCCRICDLANEATGVRCPNGSKSLIRKGASLSWEHGYNRPQPTSNPLNRPQSIVWPAFKENSAFGTDSRESLDSSIDRTHQCWAMAGRRAARAGFRAWLDRHLTASHLRSRYEAGNHRRSPLVRFSGCQA